MPNTLKIVILVIFLPMLGVAAYATSVTVTQTTLQTNGGILQNIYYETASGPSSTTPSSNTALSPSGTSGSYTIAAGTNGYLWSPSFSSATSVPTSRMMFDIWASASSTSISLDGSATGSASGTNSFTITMSTTRINDLIYVSIVEGNSFTVSAVTSTPSLTWTRRASIAFSSTRELETWYSIWSSSGSVTITVTLTGSTFASGVAFGVNGVNTASPFDSHSGVPASTSGAAGSSASVAISTSNANDFIIGAAGVIGTPSLTTGTSFTLVATQTVGGGNNAKEASAEYRIVSAAQTNLAVSYSWTGPNDWAIIADAIVAASSISISARTTDSSGILVSTLLSGGSVSSIVTSETQSSAVFTLSSGSIPAGGYIEIIITAPSGVTITVFWGIGQPTNFQIPRSVLT